MAKTFLEPEDLEAINPRLLALHNKIDDLELKLAQQRADDLTVLAAEIGVLNGRVTALEQPTVPPPPPPPPPVPPPPPPPPVEGWTVIAKLRAPAAGRVAVGVPMATSRNVGSVRVGGVLAQADNQTGRWFMLSAIVPAGGDYPIEVSEAPDTRAPVALPMPRASVSGAGELSFKGYHRRGAVVAEAVYDGNQVRIQETVWADDASSSTVRPRNSGSTPGQAMSARTYDITIAREGSAPPSYTNVQHAPHAEYVRRLGDETVFAEVVPLDGGGLWDTFVQAKFLDDWARYNPEPLSLAPLDMLVDAPPFAVTSGGPIGSHFDGTIGHFSRDQGGPGANPDIGPHPSYYLNALRNFSPAGLRILTENADKRLEAPYLVRKPDGGFHRMDEGTDYVVKLEAEAASIWALSGPFIANQRWSTSHWGAHFTLPYWVTGRLEYLEGQIAQQLISWCVTYNDGGNGRQLGRHATVAGYAYTDRGSGYTLQWRTQGWAVRTTVHLMASLPEDDARLRGLTGWDKTMVRRLWTSVQKHCKERFVDELTGPDKRFAVDGPHGPNPIQGVWKSWMWAFAVTSYATGEDLGVLSDDGKAYYRWNARPYIDIVNKRVDTDGTLSIPEFLFYGNISSVLWNTPLGGWDSRSSWPNDWNSGSGPTKTIGDTFKGTSQSAGFPGVESGYNPRYVDNPIGIEVEPPGALFGAEVTYRLTPGPSGNCFPNPANYAWYEGTYILVRGEPSVDPAQFVVHSTAIRISEVTGPNEGRGTVLYNGLMQQVALPSPIVSVALGWPCPADGRPPGHYPPMGEGDYRGWFVHLNGQFTSHGIPGAAEALAWLRAYYQRHGQTVPVLHDVEPRAAA